MEMMDALVKAAPEKGLVLTQVPKPVPGMGEVLIKIHKTAICGTDVHIYNWNQWAQETHKAPHGDRPRVRRRDSGAGRRRHGLPRSASAVSGEGHIACGHCRNCHTGNIQCVHATQSRRRRRTVTARSRNTSASRHATWLPIRRDGLPEDVVSFFDALRQRHAYRPHVRR